MRSYARWIPIAFLLCLVAGVASAAVLGDLPGHWSAALIAALSARGVVSGDPTGRYNPDRPLTRAEMAKMFSVALGREADAKVLTPFSSRFTDVPATHWGKGYIEALAEVAIAAGYGDGTYGPDDNVSRAQMAVFLVRAAGLAEKAKQVQTSPTDYRDAADVPAWASAFVKVAQTEGLMVGNADGFFLPNQPITRAEGGVVLLRLMAQQGAAYHLIGTLTRYDHAKLQGALRDELGHEHSFAISPEAQYYRAAAFTTPDQIQLLDQVWVVLGSDGAARLIDARYEELTGYTPAVVGQTLTVKTADGRPHSLRVQTGALLFLNGRTAVLDQLSGADQVYLAIDQRTGEVRMLDAVKVPIKGQIAQVDTIRGQVSIRLHTGARYPVAADALVFRNGRRITPVELLTGDPVRMATDANGAVNYVQVER